MVLKQNDEQDEQSCTEGGWSDELYLFKAFPQNFKVINLKNLDLDFNFGIVLGIGFYIYIFLDSLDS